MMHRLIIVSQVTLSCLCGYWFKNLHHYGFFRLYTDVASGSAPRKEASSVEDIWKGHAKKTVDKTRYTSLLLKDPHRRASRSFILIIFSLAPIVRKVDNAINLFPGQRCFSWIALSNFEQVGRPIAQADHPLFVRPLLLQSVNVSIKDQTKC